MSVPAPLDPLPPASPSSVSNLLNSSGSPLLQPVEPILLNQADDEEAEEQIEVELPEAALDGTQTSAAASSSSFDPNSAAASASLHSPHYATHLYNCLDRVVGQGETGRQHSKAFVQFVRAKADLDREYGERLRTLTEKYSSALDLPQRPRRIDTFEAACCAVRNLNLNLAANSILLAEKLDEDVADTFLSKAQELSEVVKPLMVETQSRSKRFHKVQQQYEQARSQLMKACQERDELKSTSTSTSKSTHREVDFLTDFVAPFRSNSASSIAKRLTQADSQYVDAIKRVRSVREEYDSQVRGELAEFEALEMKRMEQTLKSLQTFSKIHQLCFTSHLKNITAVHTTVETKIRPRHDMNTFIAESVKDSKQSIRPPPLPVYEYFRGHPQFGSTNMVSPSSSLSSASFASPSSQKSRRRQHSRSSQSRTLQQLTDSSDDNATDEDEKDEGDEAEDDAEELILSSATDDSDDDDGDVPKVLSDSSDSEIIAESPTLRHATEAISKKRNAMVTLTPMQQQCLDITLDRIFSLPSFSTAAPASPIMLQPELHTVIESFQTPVGRTKFATAMKGRVKRTTNGDINIEELNHDSNTADDNHDVDDEKDSDAPVQLPDGSYAPVSPTAIRTNSALSSTSSDPILDVSSATFDQLRTLCRSFLDASELSLHVAPVLSLLRSAKLVISSEEGSLNSSSASSSSLASSSSPTPPSSPSLFTALLSHPLFASSRWYEVSYLYTLNRLYQRHAPLHRWHSDKEQQAAEFHQRRLAFQLIRTIAKEMRTFGRVTPEQIVQFVSKMSAVHQLTQDEQSGLVNSIPAFQQLQLEQMPTLAGKATIIKNDADRRDSTQDASVDDEADANEPFSPESPSSASAKNSVEIPVAQPVQLRQKK